MRYLPVLRHYHVGKVLAALMLCSLGPVSAAVLLGPTNYLSTADSPIANLSGYDYFHLEDFEDGVFNAPGAIVANPGIMNIATPGFYTDSVDADDGVIDGSGQGGHSHYNNFGATGISYSFDEAVLGQLPTHVGVVWTEGQDSVLFEAFDALGASLGTVGPAVISDGFGNWNGGTSEDHFFGVIDFSGISSIRVTSGGSAGIEVDHLQYGYMASVPLPTTLLLITPVTLALYCKRSGHSAKRISHQHILRNPTCRSSTP